MCEKGFDLWVSRSFLRTHYSVLLSAKFHRFLVVWLFGFKSAIQLVDLWLPICQTTFWFGSKAACIMERRDAIDKWIKSKSREIKACIVERWHLEVTSEFETTQQLCLVASLQYAHGLYCILSFGWWLMIDVSFKGIVSVELDLTLILALVYIRKFIMKKVWYFHFSIIFNKNIYNLTTPTYVI